MPLNMPTSLSALLAWSTLQQGNRHFQAQEYQQAAAAYSRALALRLDDASLTAVLLCNRAASQHAAGHYLDAIADCCLAHQLDPQYPRALQVRLQAALAERRGLDARVAVMGSCSCGN
jgi:tetratricopeptide (TPR) repeat protein